MKKIVCILAAVVLMFTAGCAKENKKINIIKNTDSIEPVELTVPRELQGHTSINLISFDGQNAVFSVNRDISAGKNTGMAEETAEIVVYDVYKQQVVQYLNTDMYEGQVLDAVKYKDRLYYTAKFPWEGRHIVYRNDGLETVEIAVSESSYDEILKYESSFIISGEKLLLKIGFSGNDKSRYDFYRIEDKNVTRTHGMQFEFNARITDVVYDEENKEPFELDYCETDRHNGDVTFYEFDGPDGKILKTIREENYIYGGKTGDMLFHYEDNTEKTDYYRLCVTSLENKAEAEIDVVNVAVFYSNEDDFALFTHGNTANDMTVVDIEDMQITLTPVDTSVFAEGFKTVKISDESALIMMQNYRENSVWLYMIEK